MSIVQLHYLISLVQQDLYQTNVKDGEFEKKAETLKALKEMLQLANQAFLR